MTIAEAILILCESHTVPDAAAEDGFRTELATPDVFLGRRSGEYHEAWRVLRDYKAPQPMTPPEMIDEFNKWMLSQDASRQEFDRQYAERLTRESHARQQALNNQQVTWKTLTSTGSWSEKNPLDPRSMSQNPALNQHTVDRYEDTIAYRFPNGTVTLNAGDRAVARHAYPGSPQAEFLYAKARYDQMQRDNLARLSTPDRKNRIP